MRLRVFSLMVLSLLLLILTTAYALDEPEEGKNYIWVDLGKENEGFLLTQEEQGDGISDAGDKAGVDCRKQPFPYAGPGNNHMYFRIDDTFIFGGEHEVWIVMEYFDFGTQIDCQYDSNGVGAVDGAFRGSSDGAYPRLNPTNTETWMTHVWPIVDGRFENRANGSDFRFSTHGSGDMWIDRVWIFLYEPPDPFDPEDISRPEAVQPGDKAAITWGTLKSGF